MPVLGTVVNPPARSGWTQPRPYQGGRGDPQVTATASSNPAGGCAAILIAVNWGTPGVTTVTLTRATPDGATTVVRGSPVTLSGNLALFWDTEVPLNIPVTYTASSTQTAVTATSAAVTATTAGFGCLSDPAAAGADIPLVPFTTTPPDCGTDSGVAFVALGDEDYASTSGVFDIIAAPRPRTVTQVRQDLDSTLTLASKTLTDRTALLNLLAPGRDLLLRLTSTAYGWATDTYAAGYVSVGKVTSSRLHTADMTRPQRVWKLPIRRVDATASSASGTIGSNGVIGGGSTWGDLVDLGLTWGDLVTLGITWGDLIKGTP